MKLNRKFTLLMAIMMVVSILIAGCGSQPTPATNEPSPSGSASAEPSAPPKKDKYVIGFSHTGPENEWTNEMARSMNSTWENTDKFEYIYSDAQNKQENQIKAIRTFIQQGVDAIILRPMVTTGWDAVMEEVKESGIPLITINRKVELANGDINDYILTAINPDNIHAGELLAQGMCDIFKDVEGPVNVAILEGKVGAASTIERAKGIDNILSKQDKLVVKYAQATDFQRAKSKEVMESFLKSAKAEGVTIHAVLGHADDSCIGAIQAIEEAGLKPGVDIKLAAIDGVKGAFEAMAAGKYEFTVENPNQFGPATLDFFTDYFYNGNTNPDKWIKMDNTVYTKDQAAELLPTRTW
ncbi:MAG: substrate-binding domain-containing protein [Acetivibrionales bacterium]|jgi:ABC-type sugar transport system substrate-binding protein